MLSLAGVWILIEIEAKLPHSHMPHDRGWKILFAHIYSAIYRCVCDIFFFQFECIFGYLYSPYGHDRRCHFFSPFCYDFAKVITFSMMLRISYTIFLLSCVFNHLFNEILIFIVRVPSQITWGIYTFWQITIAWLRDKFLLIATC